MRHPNDGTLRRLLDEPAGVADADRAHVAGCPQCRAGLAAAQRDAAVATEALSGDLTAHVDAGWQRLSTAVATRERPRKAPARRWRIRSPLVAAIGVAALLAGASAAAAGDWLQIFRTERIAPVTAPEADLIKIPELDEFGELTPIEPIQIRQVTDAAAAAKATGLTVPRVTDLPKGVSGEPTYHVGARASALFTYSAERAEQTARAKGHTLPPPPPGLDGSQFRLTAGPGLAAMWGEGRPTPGLVVVRAVTPTAYSTGVPFGTARDYLLSLPILPANVAAQLKNFSAEGTTLPLFMSVEHMKSTATEVGGVPATLLTSRDRTMAAVLWLDGTVVTAVAGPLSGDEVLAVARGMGPR
ncbi:transcriptional regulator (anti-sigma factor) [Asanoa ishikariensis]|uniref:Uncharacterized protein n=1 Tax=Asanoa ishikariensis TaxID=137265 RepID=A0A1H3TI22_9ACTN|nr:hypothetical protein [Asanoa ishikariensis]GIF62382.1 transcriptional regulator (anti-sigma factor) [Asanoa ishikariensis]SDZ49933.1 hypothetical protein SAMN05421684_5814 [Asanoa ishikariensis]